MMFVGGGKCGGFFAETELADGGIEDGVEVFIEVE